MTKFSNTTFASWRIGFENFFIENSLKIAKLEIENLSINFFLFISLFAIIYAWKI
jgi:hypothetical protein